MLSNYPPGVTGHEDAFGPQSEEDVKVEATCYHCPWEGEVTATRVLWNFGGVNYFVCPECGTENEVEVVEDRVDGFDEADADYGMED